MDGLRAGDFEMEILESSFIVNAYAADAVAAAERETFAELDDPTRSFLELVDCQPDEVLAIPAGRCEVDHRSLFAQPVSKPREKKPSRTKAERKEQRKEKLALYDSMIWPWGKHKGELWRNVPEHYMRWFASLEDPYGKHGRHLRHQVREYVRWKYGEST